MSDPPTIGPSLPPHLLAARDVKGSDERIDKSMVGPQLPPTSESTSESTTLPSKASYGPCLPPGMMYPMPENIETESKDTSGYFVCINWYSVG